jgi:hypothetical protein
VECDGGLEEDQIGNCFVIVVSSTICHSCFFYSDGGGVDMIYNYNLGKGG